MFLMLLNDLATFGQIFSHICDFFLSIVSDMVKLTNGERYTTIPIKDKSFSSW